MKTKKENYFDWLFSKKSFWIISIIWGLYAGIGDLLEKQIISFLGTIAASLFITGILFFFAWLIIQGVNKKR